MPPLLESPPDDFGKNDPIVPDSPGKSETFGESDPIVSRPGGSSIPSAGIYSNLHPDFAPRLKALVDASGGRVTITDGFRSPEQQADLYRRKPTLAAAPGHSLHEQGLAADLGGDVEWAHANAGRFGLVFPMLDPKGKKYEPWHVQPDNYETLRKPTGAAPFGANDPVVSGPSAQPAPSSDAAIAAANPRFKKLLADRDAKNAAIQSDMQKVMAHPRGPEAAQLNANIKANTIQLGDIRDEIDAIAGGVGQKKPGVAAASPNIGSLRPSPLTPTPASYSASAVMPIPQTNPNVAQGKLTPAPQAKTPAFARIEADAARLGMTVDEYRGAVKKYGLSAVYEGAKGPQKVAQYKQAFEGANPGDLLNRAVGSLVVNPLHPQIEESPGLFGALLNLNAPGASDALAEMKGPWATGAKVAGSLIEPDNWALLGAASKIAKGSKAANAAIQGAFGAQMVKQAYDMAPDDPWGAGLMATLGLIPLSHAKADIPGVLSEMKSRGATPDQIRQVNSTIRSAPEPQTQAAAAPLPDALMTAAHDSLAKGESDVKTFAKANKVAPGLAYRALTEAARLQATEAPTNGAIVPSERVPEVAPAPNAPIQTAPVVEPVTGEAPKIAPAESGVQVYHGTTNDFTSFDTAKSRKGGLLTWVTENPDYAKSEFSNLHENDRNGGSVERVLPFNLSPGAKIFDPAKNADHLKIADAWISTLPTVKGEDGDITIDPKAAHALFDPKYTQGVFDGISPDDLHNMFARGDFRVIEAIPLLKALKTKGFDGVAAEENGRTYGLFDPNSHLRPNPPDVGKAVTPGVSNVDTAPTTEAKEPWQMTRREFQKSYVWHNTSNEAAAEIAKDGMKRGVFGISHGKANSYPGDVTIYARRAAVDALNPSIESFSGGQALYPEGAYSPSHEWINGRLSGSDIITVPKGSNAHRELVESALAEGKPVPPKVLADYPNLAHTPNLPDVGKESARPSSSGQLQSTILPGVQQFAEQDIAPAAYALLETARDVKAALVPAGVKSEVTKTVGNAQVTTREPLAAQAAGIVRARRGEFDQTVARAHAGLEEARKAFEMQTPKARLTFIDRMERGQKQATPELQVVADTIRDGFDQRVAEVQKYGKLENVIEDYFPHIWQDPKKAQGVLDRIVQGRRPLEGPKSFLKQRTIEYTSDGIAAGLKPVTDNPVELSLLKMREMDRYIMAQRIIGDMKDSGLAKFVRAGKEAPEGLAQINDRAFTVFGSRDAEGALRIRGQYYAPEAVARIVNNFLSPGLRGRPWYDAISWTNNILNGAQLLGAFHVGTTALNGVFSKVATGIEQASRGQIVDAALSLAKAPLAPIRDLALGNKVYREYMQPGTQGGEIQKSVNALVQAGGRATIDPLYHNASVKSFMTALRSGNYPGAVLRAVPAAVELSMKPIFEFYVPRMKLAAFHDMASMEMARLGPNASIAQVRQAMGKAWDSVDNRFGQLVTDNLMWNKILKDSMQLTVRSVGWNLGTIREVGGAALDLATTRGRMKAGEAAVSHRMAYTAAMTFTTAMIGAIYQVAHTGQAPQTLQDYFYPKTGRIKDDGSEERVTLPTYMKDLFPLGQSIADKGIPGGIGRLEEMATHKSAPIINLLAETWQNKDYYSTEIRNPDDPLVEQMKEWGRYVLRTSQPFSVKAVQQSEQRGVERTAENMIGIAPAPRVTEHSPAVNLMIEILNRSKPQGVKTLEEGARSDFIRGLRDSGRQGKDITGEAAQAMIDGKISRGQMHALIQSVNQPIVPGLFQHLELKDAVRVWEIASPAERREMEPGFAKKLRSYAHNNPGDTNTIDAAYQALTAPPKK